MYGKLSKHFKPGLPSVFRKKFKIEIETGYDSISGRLQVRHR